MNKVLVIGGGASGMMAAIYAARNGADVTLIEKNEKTGKKLYITGKGRCNLTNACDMDDFMQHILRNRRFPYAALSGLNNQDLMALFEKWNVPLKTERGERVFPVSDRSGDILKALSDTLYNHAVRVKLNCRVSEIVTENGQVTGVRLNDSVFLPCDSVILATGGISYPATGSTGDGHVMAGKLGHTCTERYPALVPVETNETWPAELSGLSLKNVKLTAKLEGMKKPFFSEQGEMLFTHFGISGPLVLTLSSLIPDKAIHFSNGRFNIDGVSFAIDLKPALDEQTLDARMLRDAEEKKHSSMAHYMDGFVPHSFGEVILRLSHIPQTLHVDQMTREMRRKLLETMKALPLTAKALRGFEEAIITRGGINVKEVDPSTMESRLVKGLYLTGELLDIDATTGGFNLQLAFSTGALAGKSAAEK